MEIYCINKFYKSAIHVLLPLPESNIPEGKLHSKESFTFQNSVVAYRVSLTGTFFGRNEICVLEICFRSNQRNRSIVSDIFISCTALSAYFIQPL